MNTLLNKFFLEDSKVPNAYFRYGFLTVIIGLLVLQAVHSIRFWDVPQARSFDGYIVPFMLLFNHLAYQFRWSPSVRLFWRVVAWSWLILGGSYIFFMLFKR